MSPLVLLAYGAVAAAVQTLVLVQTAYNTYHLLCDQFLLACATVLWCHRLYDCLLPVVEMPSDVQQGLRTVLCIVEIILFATRYAVLIGCRKRLVAFAVLHLMLPISVVLLVHGEIGLDSLSIWHGLSFLLCAAAEVCVGSLWMCLAMFFYAGGYILRLMIHTVISDTVLILAALVWGTSWTRCCRKHSGQPQETELARLITQ